MKTLRSLVAAWTATLLFAAPAPASDGPKPVTVMLDWFVNPDHAPLVVALEKGYFQQRGLEVALTAPSNPNDPPKLVAAGKAHLAVSYQHQHHLHVDRGLPLVRVATLVATPLNALVTLRDGGVRNLSELKGKTVGYSVGGFETLLLGVMLESAGLKTEDVRLVNVNFSLSPSLLSGKTDAVIGAFRNFELNQMDMEGRPGRAFFVEEHGVPAYDELILVCRRDRGGEAWVRAFVDAVEEGVRFLVNHPQEAWEAFIAGRSELDDELNRRAWRDTLPRFALRPGALDRTRYRRFADFLVERGIIGEPPPLQQWALEPTPGP
jgi:putative hydroxymethylpyrimidine transport system substrate-binding protein